MKKRFVDIEYCDQIGEELIEKLAKSLNLLHASKYSEKFWRVLLGHWVQLLIKTMHCRYKSIKYALDHYDIEGSTFIELNDSLLAGSDTLDFNSLIQNKYWNQLVYQKILQSLDFNKDIFFITSNEKKTVQVSKKSLKESLKTSLKKNIFNKIMPLFSRATDAVILNSYLPRMDEFKLQIKLGQVPQFWQSCELNVFPYEDSLRKRINISTDTNDEFKSLVWRLTPLMIPKIFLEGFKDSLVTINKLNWPKTPKFIFTSNNFAFDECFKFYTAIKTESYGSKYLVGQHGSNYGTYRGSERWPEVTTPDGFISWGWSPNIKNLQVIPAFNFKVSGKKSLMSYDKSGKMLIIKRGPGTRDGPQDRNYEHIVYQERVFNFFTKLREDIKSQLIVRLHYATHFLDSSDRALWEEHKDFVELNLGFDNIWDLIARSRLVVHTYDSTTFLETLTLNIPTIGLWREGLDHLSDEAKPFYQKLVDSGIIQLDADVAVSHIEQNWHDIDSWWNNADVQKQRQIFCQKYALEVKNPSSSLVKVLNKAYFTP